jgi:hypothetical protein
MHGIKKVMILSVMCLIGVPFAFSDFKFTTSLFAQVCSLCPSRLRVLLFLVKHEDGTTSTRYNYIRGGACYVEASGRSEKFLFSYLV